MPTPGYRAASRARMKRLRADPAFAARRLAACSLLAETRAAIIAALRDDPNASRAARKIGVAHSTVCKLARAAGIRLRRGGPSRAARAQRA